MATGIIFDCDGVLIDSANVWRDTENELCAQAARPLTREETQAIVTMTIGEVASFMHETIGLGEEPGHVVRMIDELMLDFYKNRATPISGIHDLLAALKDRGAVMSVVSSSPKEYLEAGLARIGLADEFCGIFSVEDLNTSKRDPLIFLHALDAMGTTPESTWGFDDSYYAIRTMARMGIRTVGVYDAQNPYELLELRKASHIVTSDYSSLDLSVFFE